ncbi:MAG: PQQ-binding-like beta-propeller repeat protein [Chloroherpetonaceae bacterium]|nr:PQQ-binding-like beta-propeller repeat protein [Chthonomonadaceae bacterium]MDW8207232.1 PQQ-binding-like beta-propeller repeat protein [Chloroherpetonaceae bacterium]
MKHSIALAVCAGMCGFCMPLPAQDTTFKDPAPPVVMPLTEVPAPVPRPQQGLRFFAPPRPLASNATTHDWRSFQGPTHNGVSTETPLLQRWPRGGPAKVWEVPKGEGYATPAVVGDRVILFHRIGNEEIVECLHAETGQRFWKVAYPTAYQDEYGYSGGPRCQPISDGEHVFTFGAEGKLHCILLKTGQIVWKRDILSEFGLKQNYFGVGSTPLLEGDLLIINVGAPGGPCVAAFHRKTGRMVWGAGKDWGQSYASPVPATIHGRRRILVFAGGKSQPPSGGLLCIDPANGAIDFALPWRARRYESVNASAPLVIGNQVFLSECYGPGGVLLDLKPDGSFTRVWETRDLRTHFMTAIHRDGYLYGIDGHGPRNAPLVCIDLRTGKEKWRWEPEWEETVETPEGRRQIRLGQGLASMMLVDGRCLMLSEYGHLVWLDLNPEGYRELDRTRLFLARETWGMPALSRGLLYVCQNHPDVLDGSPPRLICYDLRGSAAGKE